MKKLICFLLTALLLVGLCACGEPEKEESKAESNSLAERSEETTEPQDVSGGTSDQPSEPEPSEPFEPSEPSEPDKSEPDVSDPEPTEELTLPDFSSMLLTDFFPEGNIYFALGADTFRVIDSYVRGDLEKIQTDHGLNGSAVLPAQAPRNTIADYGDYCITQLSADAYELDGRQVEKVTVHASLHCTKEGQSGYEDFCLEFVHARRDSFPYREWQLLRLEVQSGRKPWGDTSVPVTNPMTVEAFLASSDGLALQAIAFNFINAYYSGDIEALHNLLVDDSWLPEDSDAWSDRSRDDYTGYGISWVSFESYELHGEQVQGARYYLSMYRAVPGEEGVCDPLMTFVKTRDGWRLLDLDFDA
ncbi:MAG: hypothetical protein J1E00_09020 [Oscillospiraceae bacterium]|nr:hypothetical protein [Oscillospiraceae bacterium]